MPPAHTSAATISINVDTHTPDSTASTAVSSIPTIAVSATAISAPSLHDAPPIFAVASSVNEDGTVALTITPHFESDPRSEERRVGKECSSPATPSNNREKLTPVGGDYTLRVANLAGLTLHAPHSDLASISMNVQAHATDSTAATADSAVQTDEVIVTA